MDHSESITEICAALIEVQKAVDHVEKDGANPHYGNAYTKLPTLLKAVREPLWKNGITMVQAPGMRDGWVTVETLLVHQSGEWMKSEAAAPMQKDDPQGVGSAITYLCRYSLASLLAIPQEDDDGNAASRTPKQNGSKKSDNVDRYTGEIDGPTCPQCGGPVWDNREKKRDGSFNPRSPDFACRDKDDCGWTLWLDSAEEKIRERLTEAHDGGLIDKDQYETNIESLEQAVRTGDLDQLRITTNWLRNLKAAHTGEDREAMGSGV